MAKAKAEGITVDLDDLQKSIWQDDYLTFFIDFWDEIPANANSPLILSDHIPLVAGELQKIGERILNREPNDHDLIINIPPGSSKSTLSTILFPVWLWINNPGLRIISTSHSASLAMAHAGASRDVIASDKFQHYFGDEVVIRKDEDNKKTYKTTAGGARFTTSTGGSVTGMHADIILIDDPIDASKADSDAFIGSATHYINKTLPTRLTDKKVSTTIMIMQRLHQEDPTGSWLKDRNDKGKKVRHICLPATDDYPVFPEEFRSIYQSGYLDPKRMGQDVLDKQLIALGEADYAGQFGQQPSPPGGLVVKKDWLQVVDSHDLPRKLVEDVVMDFVADTAQETKDKSDPSGIMAFKYFKGYLFVFDYIADKWAFPDLVDAVKGFVGRRGSPNSLVVVEPKSSGISLVQYIERFTDLNITKWKMPEGDKMNRLKSITPFLRAGKVFFVRGPWNDKFIQELTMFPKAPHDESVDCLIMACHETLMEDGDKGGGGYSAHT